MLRDGGRHRKGPTSGITAGLFLPPMAFGFPLGGAILAILGCEVVFLALGVHNQAAVLGRLLLECIWFGLDCLHLLWFLHSVLYLAQFGKVLGLVGL